MVIPPNYEGWRAGIARNNISQDVRDYAAEHGFEKIKVALDEGITKSGVSEKWGQNTDSANISNICVLTPLFPLFGGLSPIVLN